MKEQRIDRINRWLTLGANIGVVLGLIILIVEVRQNAELTRAGMEHSMNDLLAEIELSLSTPEKAEVWVKSFMAPETMTDADMKVVESHLVALMMQWDYLFQMEESGLANRARITQHIRNTAPFYFGNAFAKNWFRAEAQGWEGTAMMEVAVPIVEGLDDDFMKNHWLALRPKQPGEPAAPAEAD